MRSDASQARVLIRDMEPSIVTANLSSFARSASRTYVV